MGTTYRCTGNKDIPLAWRCRKCGEMNFGTYKISLTGSANNEERAKAMMSEAIEKAAINAALDLKNCSFDQVRLKHKCSSCGDTPPWSNLSAIPPKVLSVLRTIALIATVVLGFISMALSQGPEKRQYTVWSIVAAVFFAVLALACLIIKKKMLSDAERAIKALPPENLPKMAPSERELGQILVEDGLLSPDEAKALGGSNYIPSGRKLSDRYASMAAERKTKLRNKQIIYFFITTALLLIFGGIQINSIQTSDWKERMDASNLFTANNEAGDKFIIYEDREIFGRGEYKRTYLPSEYLASKPEEVGYIIEVNDSQEAVGTYRMGTVNSGFAYRIHTKLSLFDCHTGEYIGSPIELVGGEPPSTISSKSFNGYGSRPDDESISSAAYKLVQRIQR